MKLQAAKCKRILYMYMYMYMYMYVYLLSLIIHVCVCVCVCSVLRGGVTAAALEEYGPGLIAHCIAKWFIDNKIPAEFITRLPSDPHDLPDGGK